MRDEPGWSVLEVRKKAKELSSNFPCEYPYWKTGVTLSMEISGQAIPRIPSNFAAIKETPISFVASPNCTFVISTPPKLTVS